MTTTPDTNDQIMNDLKTVLADDHGKRLIAHLLKHYGLFKLSYSQTGHTEFNEGMRMAALYLSQLISIVNPSAFGDIVTTIQDD
jgi:hypothetical protein